MGQEKNLTPSLEKLTNLFLNGQYLNLKIKYKENIMTTNFKRAISNVDDTQVITITTALNNLLANEFALFTKTLNYHWNVTGPRFHSLHNFLEEHYRELLDVMDGVAERVRFFGETPLSTVKRMSEEMDLNEVSGKGLSSSEMIDDLFKSHIKIQSFIKEVVAQEEMFKNDPGTEDYLVGLLQKHEMMSWMLKSHLD